MGASDETVATPSAPRDAPADEQDPLLGTTLADAYRIDAILADGGMSRLYRGFHVRLELPVAVKVSNASRSIRSSSVDRAEREARVMATIRSENVVRVLDLCQTPDHRPCMITELLEGMDLAEHVNSQGPLPVDRSLSIAIDVCRGVSVAHQHGLVHRDLKPSNVFLARQGDVEIVKVLDFGVAKLEGGATLTQEGAFLGTPSFMAPEQAAAASNVDERADVYAIGAILYNMLAATPPYGKLQPHQTLMKLLQGPPPPLRSVAPDLPPDLVDVVEDAMAREPDRRVSTVAELQRRLESLGAQVSVPKPPRWRHIVALMAAVLGALGVGAWVAALIGAISFGRLDPTIWASWIRHSVQSIPPTLSLLVLLSLFRSVIRVWRSPTRLRRVTQRIVRTVVAGLVAYAVVVTTVAAAQGWMLDPSPIFPLEQLTALLVAATTALIVSLRKSSG